MSNIPPSRDDFDSDSGYLGAFSIWLKSKSDDDCLEDLLVGCVQKEALICKRCNQVNRDIPYGARSIKCSGCHQKVWRTADTFLSHKKHPKAILAWLNILGNGVTASSAEVCRIVGNAAYATVLATFHNVTRAIFEELKDNESVQAHSAEFIEVFRKRSRETPVRQRPQAQQEEMEREWNTQEAETDYASTIANENNSDVRSDLMSPEEELLYNLLSDVPIRFDHLCDRTEFSAGQLSARLTMLEIYGLAERKPGDFYVAIRRRRKAQQQVPSEVITSAINNAVDLITKVFQGISRKYLQNYVAAYWCSIDRKRWQPRAILDAFIELGPMSRNDLKRYVTPEFVSMWPLATASA